jgi:hypothetical protein
MQLAAITVAAEGNFKGCRKEWQSDALDSVLSLNAALDAMREPLVCYFTQFEPNDELYLTGCGKEFHLEPGKELHNCCHFCGGSIIAKTHE